MKKIELSLFLTLLTAVTAWSAPAPSASPSPTPTAQPKASATPTAAPTASAKPSPAAAQKLAPKAAPKAKEQKVAPQKTPQEQVITLERAYDIALASDQTIRTAYYEIRKGNLQPWSALTRLGPQIYGSVSYTNAHSSTHYHADTIPASSPVNPIRTDVDSRFSGFTYNQPLFDPSVFPAYRYGKLVAQAAQLQYRFTVREVLFGVAQAYYNVLKQQRLVVVNKETVALASEQLNTAQAKFDAGSVARIDVLRARSTLENANNQLIQSQGALDIAKDVLSNILNLGGKTNFHLVEPPDEAEPSTPFESLLSSAYTRREDYRVSAIGIEQQVALKGQVLAQYGPVVSAGASIGWADSHGPGAGRNYDRAATISVSVPFLTGGQREIDLIGSNYKISQARLALEKTTKEIESDVRTAWISVNTGKEALRALSAEVAASSQNYTDLQAQYQAGAATSLDAQTALRDLNTARSALTNQIYDYQIALRNLKRAQADFEKRRVDNARAISQSYEQRARK